MRRGSAQIAVTAFALLAGCKAVGPDFQSPPAPAQTGYVAPGEAASAVTVMSPDVRTGGAWWMAFNSAELDRAVRDALVNNPTLAAADATLERAREQVAAERGKTLPQVDLSASIQEERINITAFGFSFPGISNPTISLYSIGPTVNYDLDLFGGRRRSVEASIAKAQGEARRADAAYLTLTGQVTGEALTIATLKAELATLDQVVANDQRVIDMVQKAVEAGGQPSSATTAGISQLAQDEAIRPRLQQQLAIARHALALLTGKAPADEATPQFQLADFTAPAQVPVALPSVLVRRRPDILAAEADLHAAVAEIGVEEANLYPDIKLSANFIQSAVAPGALTGYGAAGWYVGAALAQPLFHGGTLKANKRAAEAEARASLARYRQTVLAAFTQVADVMQAIAHDDEELAALSRAEDAAVANARDTQLSFSLGGGPLLPVIDAERQLANVRRDLVRAQGQRLADIAQLFVAVAADWREEPPQTKTP
jgi:NodT family efflux transporter outer membrane factor (OMF) lipoprotein